jgi:protein gp37
VELVEKHLMDPLHWKKPQRVFVNSMSDLFHEALPDEAIDRVFAVMALCPQHTFQVLTKRPERMNRYVSGKQHGRMCKIARQIPVRGEKPNARFPLSNVWLGVSVEDQKTADERIPLLLQTPAAVRFVSYEPALGPVDFDETRDWLTWNYVYRRNRMNGCMNTIDQVIVGGESGPGARPFNIEWARNVIAQCKDAGTKVFFKQAGSNPVLDNNRLHLNDRKGGDLSELPSDIGLREYPDAV